MAQVGLVFGGRSVEHEVSIVSARNVARALEEGGHGVIPLGIGPDGAWVEPAAAVAALAGEVNRLAPAGEPIPATLHRLLASGVEVIFPIVHGTWGEDGCLQGLCEMLDLPYVGPGVSASAVAMDKLLCKAVLEKAGLPVGRYLGISRRRFEADPEAAVAGALEVGLPAFVKPSVGGSSVGIQKVSRGDLMVSALETAFRFDDRVIVERGIAGRELECAVLGHAAFEASAIGEIVPGKEFYDYADKYLEDGAQLLAPADLPEAVTDELRRLAIRAFEAIGGSGLARVDFFLEGADRLLINEINTLPGFTAISMYPRLWQISGVPPARLADRLVQMAFERQAGRRRLDRGIAEWLAELHA